MADRMLASLLEWLEAECEAAPGPLPRRGPALVRPRERALPRGALRTLSERPLLVLAFARPEVHDSCSRTCGPSATSARSACPSSARAPASACSRPSAAPSSDAGDARLAHRARRRQPVLPRGARARPARARQRPHAARHHPRHHPGAPRRARRGREAARSAPPACSARRFASTRVQALLGRQRSAPRRARLAAPADRARGHLPARHAASASTCFATR